MKLLAKPKSPYIRQIGTVKIEATELISILKNSEFSQNTTLTVKNGKYEFDSLLDIEENIALLLGQPNFVFKTSENSIHLNFEKGLKLELENTQNESEVAAFDKIVNKMKAFRTPFFFLGDTFVYFIFIGIIIINLFGLCLLHDAASIRENSLIHALLKRTTVIAALLGGYISHNIFTEQVILSRNKGVWNEIHNKSLSNLILFIGGAFLFWSVTQLGARP